MLIFKNNVYQKTLEDDNPAGANAQLDPYSFLLRALMADRELFMSLRQLDGQDSALRLSTLFPHSAKFGSAVILNSLSKRLLEALVHPDTWYQMNAYHFCYLYDCLYSLVEDYSYENREGRLNLLPELDGEDIDFEGFLLDYFYNTTFLMDQDRFNDLTAKDKTSKMFSDSCLFGVINKLIPAENEIQLQIVAGNPYS
jgi:hypothetical protein